MSNLMVRVLPRLLAVFLLGWSAQAEYDVLNALQLTQKVLDEQMVVSVALANVNTSTNSSTNIAGHHHDEEEEDFEHLSIEEAEWDKKKAVEKDEDEELFEDADIKDKRVKDAHKKHEDDEEVVAEDVSSKDEKDEDDPKDEGHKKEALEEAALKEQEEKDEIEIEQNSSLAEDGYGRTRSPAERIKNLIAKFVYSKAPMVNKHVTKRRPLLFMHQAKSGGTSLREVMYKASRQHGLAAFIPCNGGVKCSKFDIEGQSAAVYGGHFCWKATTNNLYRKGVHGISCVTVFREPVSRIMSCYSYRLVGQLGKAPSCISRVSPSRLKQKLVENQCVNEPFRRIGDCNVATRLEHHKSDEAQVSAWETTLSHLSGCIPIILEEPSSYKLAAKAFPQFGEAFHKMRQVKLNKNKKYVDHCKPSPAHIRAVKEVAGHEIRMYKAAKKRMWRLKEELKVY